MNTAGADLLTSIAILCLASAAIGAWLEYLAASIRHGRRR